MTSWINSKTPSINVFPDHRINPINRLIYSGFTEHMGRCIYGGIYDPDNTNKDLINDDGFRLDVIEAIKPLKIPVFRYPGGNFCATYHWEDGVGPREKRPAYPELAWGTVETNHFGTDEFMKWCKAVDAEPYLCFNFGTGTLDEALNWVDYCNGTKNTKYANMRRANGHEEPYNVKYWALGNEMWGDWQVNQLTPEAYAEKALRKYFLIVMKPSDRVQNGAKPSNFSSPKPNSSSAVLRALWNGTSKYSSTASVLRAKTSSENGANL